MPIGLAQHNTEPFFAVNRSSGILWIMQLSLSVRVAESFGNKRVSAIPLGELAGIAADAGYDALCMRASVVGVHSAAGAAGRVRRTVAEHGLTVSMVTADFAVPENSPEGPNSLRQITPSLDLAEALGADLIRICMKTEEDIIHAQRAADEARERSIRLAHQSHTRSLFETVEGSVAVLSAVGRANFGIIYEPANLALCGQEYGESTLRAFQPWLFNVYLQNHTPEADGLQPMETWTRGEVMSTLRPLDAPGGIDFASIFDGLRAIGYDGCVTMHQAFGGDMTPEDATRRTAAFLRGLLG